MHGYELRRRLVWLTGHFRPLSDGALYPAIARLERKGLLAKRRGPGEASAQRYVLSLTPRGEAELVRRLRSASDVDISDRNRFFAVLAFLGNLEPADQRAILARRLEFLKGAARFFARNGKPVRLMEEQNPFRLDILVIAREAERAEERWLRDMIARIDELRGLERDPALPDRQGALHR